ncbi:MAG: hypothetical protein PHD11_03255 [Bacteroidales bacterium]|nr:hypothetical protein [Bacteroidales bacterium]MDD4669756.1 hypothetical protein [Bacteroidales bacterium]
MKQTDDVSYTPPTVEVVEVMIEKGFAESIPGIGFGRNDFSGDDL